MQSVILCYYVVLDVFAVNIIWFHILLHWKFFYIFKFHCIEDIETDCANMEHMRKYSLLLQIECPFKDYKQFIEKVCIFEQNTLISLKSENPFIVLL